MRKVVPSLTEREKWYQNQPNLEIGDIVIIIAPANPRGTWPTGQVIQVIAGPDKIFRSAVVQSNGTEHHRPAHKLLLLESVRIRNAPASAVRMMALFPFSIVSLLFLSFIISFNCFSFFPPPTLSVLLVLII
jgi:hypothetical protein